MEPQYSILYFKEELTSHHDKIRKYLLDGIKIFWFGQPQECEVLQREFPEFIKEFFLQTYDISNVESINTLHSVEVIDGVGLDDRYASLFEWLKQNIYAFNAAQYRVEHCNEKSNIVVKASERGIVDVETLQKVNADIIASINEVVKIHEEGSKHRAEAQQELAKIEKELKQALLEAGNQIIQ